MSLSDKATAMLDAFEIAVDKLADHTPLAAGMIEGTFASCTRAMMDARSALVAHLEAMERVVDAAREVKKQKAITLEFARMGEVATGGLTEADDALFAALAALDGGGK